MVLVRDRRSLDRVGLRPRTPKFCPMLRVEIEWEYALKLAQPTAGVQGVRVMLLLVLLHSPVTYGSILLCNLPEVLCMM